MPQRGYAIGLEFSTQSAKALVLDIDSGEVAHTLQIEYDEAFPAYGTRGGVLPHSDPAVRHTDPAMLLEALDLVFARLVAAGAPVAETRAVKLDAQQHCTVYTDASLTDRLAGLTPAADLAQQISPAFTRASAPIWEDRSTGTQARRLEELLEKDGGLSLLTGNRAELRFPAAQILKWGKQAPADYDRSAHIMVLSAFLTSVLSGSPAPVDPGDGWGTNLNHADIEQPGWSSRVLAAMDAELSRAGAKTGLRGKLGEMVPYDTALGTVAPYFADRYGLPRDCTVLAGTGDNPATLLGTGGRIVISLGSSFTVNGVLERVEPQRDAEYNIFGYTPGTAMGLSVITNGAKVHDSFLEHYVGEKDWERYLELADGPSVSAREDLLLPYEQAESVPRAPAGVVRDGFSDADAATNIRALHVSQAVSLKLHAAHLSAPDAVCIVGGASRNSLLRRMITDAFGARSYAIQHGEYAAPLGCAVAAARHVTGESYTEAADRFVRAVPGSELEPNHAMRRPYEELTTRYAELERTVAE